MSGFAKLYSSILGSSISDHRVGFDQLDCEGLRAMTKDLPWVRWIFMDLLALANARGVIDYTRPRLSQILGVPQVLLDKALDLLEAPDPYSRCSDFEGRRLVPRDGRGWWIPTYGQADTGAVRELPVSDVVEQAQAAEEAVRGLVDDAPSTGRVEGRETGRVEGRERALVDTDTDTDPEEIAASARGAQHAADGLDSESSREYRSAIWRALKDTHEIDRGFNRKSKVLLRGWETEGIPAEFVARVIRESAGASVKSLFWFRERIPERWDEAVAGPQPPDQAETVAPQSIEATRAAFEREPNAREREQLAQWVDEVGDDSRVAAAIDRVMARSLVVAEELPQRVGYFRAAALGDFQKFVVVDGMGPGEEVQEMFQARFLSHMDHFTPDHPHRARIERLLRVRGAHAVMGAREGFTQAFGDLKAQA